MATCPLVVCSIYDTTPVHFFLMCCYNITWLEKTRQKWNKSTITMRLGRFLRLAINYSYNMNMNNVDVSDQLRGSYRPDRWNRKQKWWWLIFFWCHGTLLVNAYFAYKRHMEMEGAVPMSHYDFRKEIVLAKVDPLGHGAPTYREYFAVQRGDPRAMSRMIKKRKDRSTYKKRQTMYPGSKRYATKQPDAKCPSAKKKMGIYVTANRVGIESIGMSATRLNLKLPHHHGPLPHLEGKAYGYGICCSLCRWETGNKYMAQLS